MSISVIKNDSPDILHLVLRYEVINIFMEMSFDPDMPLFENVHEVTLAKYNQKYDYSPREVLEFMIDQSDRKVRLLHPWFFTVRFNRMHYCEFYSLIEVLELQQQVRKLYDEQNLLSIVNVSMSEEIDNQGYSVS